MNTIEKLEKKQLAKLLADKQIPDFAQGDTLQVDVKVREGERERVQSFEGICIAKKNRGLNSSFTVRKLSYGEGVERVFPLFSPIIEKISVLRKGKVRRAKLYYLRGRTGKAARISEKVDLKAMAEAKENKVKSGKKAEAKPSKKADKKAPPKKAAKKEAPKAKKK